MEPSSSYIALGDSMSIDLYPRLELQAQGRVPDGEQRGVGASSLFFSNDDELWPSFSGRDLSTRLPRMELVDLCVDGATIPHTLDTQLPTVTDELARSARVVTVTAGGNDLLGGIFDGRGGVQRAAEAAIRRYRELGEVLDRRFPSATLILTTVYDPTDGSGVLPGVSTAESPLPLELLERFNQAVRDEVGRHDRARLADAHRHFLGHGLSAPAGERWYWEPSPIEPGARGASEIRRLWLEALER